MYIPPRSKFFDEIYGKGGWTWSASVAPEIALAIAWCASSEAEAVRILETAHDDAGMHRGVDIHSLCSARPWGRNSWHNADAWPQNPDWAHACRVLSGLAENDGPESAAYKEALIELVECLDSYLSCKLNMNYVREMRRALRRAQDLLREGG